MFGFGRRQRRRAVELSGHAWRLLEYYMARSGIEDPGEAASRLVEEGYKRWIEESSREGGEAGAWASLDWASRVAAGYAYYRLRLRDAVEEMRRLTMTLSGVLADLKACLRDPGGFRDRGEILKRLEAYEAELKRYVDEFITSLRRDYDSGDRYTDDEELLEVLEGVVEEYRRILAEKLRGRSGEG